MSDMAVDAYLTAIDEYDRLEREPSLRERCIAKWGPVLAPSHWLRIRIRQAAHDLGHDGLYASPEAAADDLTWSTRYNWPEAGYDWAGTYAKVLMGIEQRLDRR